MVIIGENTVNLSPQSSSSNSLVEVSLNGQPLELRPNRTNELISDGVLLAQMYELPSGAAQLTFPNQSLTIAYDGVRVLLQASNEYRDRIRGLCGTFNGDTITDFMTPKNCVVRDPEVFAATYAITDETCDAPSRKMKERIRN